MKARTKSALLLFVTLLVGVLIGALGNSTLQTRRMEQIRKTFERRGSFTEMVLEVLQPENDAQRTEIQAVLEKAEARFREDRHTCHEYFVATRDSMRTDLASILTPAQQTRLEEWLTRDPGRDRDRNGRDRDRDGPDRRKDQQTPKDAPQ